MTINQNQRQYAVGILTNSLAVQRAIQALEKADFPNFNILLNNQSDATSAMRRAQANADMRAREQHYERFGKGDKRANSDLQSEVRSKLEVNLPTAQLAVKAEEGVITVVGIVPTQKELNRIETLAKEIRGVERVNVRAIVPTKSP